MVPIGHVLVDCPLKNCLKDFVDGLNLVILLWIVRGENFMVESQQERQILKNIILTFTNLLQVLFCREGT